MGNSAKRDARAADRAELQRKALELRKAGASYDQIADQLGFANKSGAWKIVRDAIGAVIREPATEVLKIELARLDAMLLGCWTKAKSGDVHAVDRVLRIMDRRAAYLGLDAPKAIHFDLSKLSDDDIKRLAGGDVAPIAGAGAEGTAAPDGEGSESDEDDAGAGEGSG